MNTLRRNLMPLSPVYLVAAVYDRAKAEGVCMDGYEKMQPMPTMALSAPPQRSSVMNRSQRRAALRKAGLSWDQARKLTAAKASAERMESDFAAKASRLTPEQARQALAEWAAKPGRSVEEIAALNRGSE